jgi:hypothetical protein
MQEQVNVATSDEQQGMDWWNQLPEYARKHWLQRAQSAVPADAWAAYKSAAAERTAELLVDLSKFDLDATRDDLERFCNKYPWAAVDCYDTDDSPVYFYVIEHVPEYEEDEQPEQLSEEFGSLAEAWRDAVRKFRIGSTHGL